VVYSSGREKLHANMLMQASIANELACEKAYIQGVDRKGRPLMIIQVPGWVRKGQQVACCCRRAGQQACICKTQHHSTTGIPLCTATDMVWTRSEAQFWMFLTACIPQVRKHNGWTRSLDELERFCCYILDKCVALASEHKATNPRGQCCCLLDLTDMGALSMDIQAIKTLFQLLGEHYVERWGGGGRQEGVCVDRRGQLPTLSVRLGTTTHQFGY
jgi:hypothetical protein